MRVQQLGDLEREGARHTSIGGREAAQKGSPARQAGMSAGPMSSPLGRDGCGATSAVTSSRDTQPVR
jgi:hypothetical protein